MKKADATRLLGGTPTEAASKLGMTPQAYSQWPADLPRRLEDRVVAAIARKHLPPDVRKLLSVAPVRRREEAN